jgi:hypothetical protein
MTIFLNSCRLCGNVEKYARAKHVTDDTIIRRMRFAFYIIEGTNIRAEYIPLLVLYGKNGYANTSQYDFYTYIACPLISFSTIYFYSNEALLIQPMSRQGYKL